QNRTAQPPVRSDAARAPGQYARPLRSVARALRPMARQPSRSCKGPHGLQHLDPNEADVGRRIGDYYEDEVIAPGGTDSAPLRFELHERRVTELRRSRRQPGLSIQRCRQRRDTVSVLANLQVRVDDETVDLVDH